MVSALDHLPDFLHNLRIGQGHDIAELASIGDGGQYPPHDLA